jgi:hypothetical protein
MTGNEPWELVMRESRAYAIEREVLFLDAEGDVLVRDMVASDDFDALDEGHERVHGWGVASRGHGCW